MRDISVAFTEVYTAGEHLFGCINLFLHSCEDTRFELC
ncbi:hypothetical protein CYPRO_0769 [Cyclonatronum proteinivorum]|uniref:Uncharacterized protein n=1 Tax=Cyclonatronum proteinivorum TaxID=1457365 RepID=A0A345UHV0_9BACT|nr:hypothetical protein CYPRO_0769 [Cyclonatronum proteinivorum]